MVYFLSVAHIYSAGSLSKALRALLAPDRISPPKLIAGIYMDSSILWVTFTHCYFLQWFSLPSSMHTTKSVVVFLCQLLHFSSLPFFACMAATQNWVCLGSYSATSHPPSLIKKVITECKLKRGSSVENDMRWWEVQRKRDWDGKHKAFKTVSRSI